MTRTSQKQIVDFQTAAATSWLVAGDQTKHHKLRFISYFTAFNALYWLQGLFEPQRRESDAIANMVEQLGSTRATELLRAPEVTEFIAYLRERGAIRNMDRRNLNDAKGGTSPGKEHMADLADGNDAMARLKSLALVLYLIRCNMVHGSKLASPDEDELVARGNPALLRLVRACLDHTLAVRGSSRNAQEPET